MDKCKCCENPATPRNSSSVYGFNRLNGKSFEWAVENGLPRSEYCVHVKGGKKFSGPDWIKRKCGDGRTGFSTRRRRQDGASIEVGQDGQFKAGRKTNVRRKSARSTFSRRATRIDGSRILSGITFQRDPIIQEQRRKEYKKLNRSENRNNRARRGHERNAKRN